MVKIHIVNSFDYEYLNPNNKYFDDNRDILLEAGFEELELGKHRFSRPYFEVNSLASFASEESSSVSIVLWRSKKEICERILDIIFENLGQRTPYLDLTEINEINNLEDIIKEYQLKPVNNDLPF